MGDGYIIIRPAEELFLDGIGHPASEVLSQLEIMLSFWVAEIIDADDSILKTANKSRFRPVYERLMTGEVPRGIEVSLPDGVKIGAIIRDKLHVACPDNQTRTKYVIDLRQYC